VRLIRPRARSLVVRRLGVMPFALFASEGYLNRTARLRGARDLAAHDWIGFDASLDGTPTSRWMRRHVPTSRWMLRSNTTTVLVAACAAGHGLLLMPAAFARAYPGLVRVLPRMTLPIAEMWAATHPDLYPSARIKAVLAWLAAIFAGPAAAAEASFVE
jgi:DNA-binding transcriptional LysR family regulator